MIRAKLEQVQIDHVRLQKAVAAGNRRALSKCGAYVRRRAMSSIKKAPKIDLATGKLLGRGRRKAGLVTGEAQSAPGTPPYSHQGLLKNLILFAVEGPTSVIIGPKLLPSKAGTAPKALEKGGSSLLAGRHGTYPRTIRARPFMVPAMLAELPRFPSLWAGEIY